MKAIDFDLPGVDGKRHGPASARGPNGLVVMFICNHCPYVKRVLDRIVRDCGELKKQGVGSIAVMSNDPLPRTAGRAARGDDRQAAGQAGELDGLLHQVEEALAT